MPRTDNDSWDLASSVGATATAVAASRAMASNGPDALLDDPFADPLVRAVGLEHFVKMVDGEIAIDDDPLLTRRAMNEQIAVRTRFFDTFFTSAAAAGVRQAVILASGLDTRAYRLPWPADTAVFEVDQPEVIAFKSATLDRLGATPRATLRTVGIDLRDDWPTALRDSRVRSSGGHRVDSRGIAGVPAARRPGSSCSTTSPRCRRPAAGWPPNTWTWRSLPEDFARLLTERSRRFGSEIDLVDLFYAGERNSAGDYLSSLGWTVTRADNRGSVCRQWFSASRRSRSPHGMAGTSGYLSAILK